MASNPWKRALIRGLLLLAMGMGPPLLADLSNPSTLIFKEHAPSQFKVELILPLINGKAIKARPLIPDICQVNGEPTVQITNRSVKRVWDMSCDPKLLYGEKLGIHGLLGSNQDVLFRLETLNGRKHEKTLIATQPFFIIPEPPNLVALTFVQGVNAARNGLRQWDVFLLLLVGFFFTNRKTTGWIGTVFFVSFCLTQSIHFFDISPQPDESFLSWRLLPICIVFFALFLKPEFLRKNPQRWIFLLSGCLGCIQAYTTHWKVVPGLSFGEQQFILIPQWGGLGLSMLLFATLIWNTHRFYHSFNKDWNSRIAFVLGSITLGLLLFFFWESRAGGLAPPFWSLNSFISFLLLTHVFMMSSLHFDEKLKSYIVGTGFFFFCLGLILGHFFPNGAMSSSLQFGLIGLIVLVYFSKKRRTQYLSAGLALSTCIIFGVAFTQLLSDYYPTPLANALPQGVFLFLIVGTLSMVLLFFQTQYPKLNSILQFFAILWILGVQFKELNETWIPTLQFNWSLGFITIPIFSGLLFLLALFFIPKKRKFQPDQTRISWKPFQVCGFLSIIFLSQMNASLKMPFFTPTPLDEQMASSVITMLLEKTYLAFNESNEDKALDRLDETLSQQLIADVYLDSRRRLTTGMRQGAVVQVKEIALHALKATGKSNTYECKWLVTAKVTHWTHIHFRQNVYIGDISMTIENNKWKISKITLKSEDREVISGEMT